MRGKAPDAQTDAFRWSQAGGYELLPRPTGVSATTSMLALQTSEDGGVVTGRIADEGQDGPFGATHKMFVWFAKGNRTVIVDHLFPEENPPRTRGILISGDGKTIIGRADQYVAHEGRKPRSINRPFVWSEHNGVQLIDTPWLGTDSGGISAISYDGSILVGTLVRYADDPEARPRSTRSGIVWQNGKAHSAEAYLSVHGLDTSAWRITNVIDVSADGQTLIGSARSVQDGRTVGWLARLGVDNPATPISNTAKITEAEENALPIVGANEQPLASEPSDETEAPLSEREQTTDLPAWEVLGFWNYDGADGLFFTRRVASC